MSAAKADMVLRELDKIKTTIDEAQRILGISPQPIPQWFAPPISPAMALFAAAYDRAKLQPLLDRVPEPDIPTREAHVNVNSKGYSKRREAAE